MLELVRRIAPLSLLAVLATLAWSRGAAAQQVVLLDQVVNPSRGAPNLQKSEYTVHAQNFANPSPASLSSPVNYAEGNIHVRLEVLTKPSAVETLFTLCLRNDTTVQTCIRYLPKYTKPGVYEYDQPITGQYNYDTYDFGRPVNRVLLAIKDAAGALLDPSDPAFDSFFPTELRVTVALVAKGSTFVPPMVSADAGTPPPPRDAGGEASTPPQDASVSPPARPDAATGAVGGSAGSGLVLVDQRLTATAQSAADSKITLTLRPDAPASLRSPIDYGAGKLHARVEVFSKPSGAPTNVRACLESSSGKTLCTDNLGGQSYLSESAIDHEQAFGAMPSASSYDFGSPLRRTYLTLSDAFGASVAGNAQFFPTELRVILTLLPQGVSYVPPWEQGPDAGSGGQAPSAGAADAGGEASDPQTAPAGRDAGRGSSGDAGTRTDAEDGPDEDEEPGGGDGDVFEDGSEGCALTGPRSESPFALASLAWCALAIWLTCRRRSGS